MKTILIVGGAAILTATLPPSVYGQSGESVSDPSGAPGQSNTARNPVEEVVVLGTRRVGRTALESTVPIDTFGSADLLRQGPTDTNELLRALVPSFNFQAYGNRDSASMIRPPTLRGLPPDNTLVLVNGKRFHRSALVQFDGDALTQGSQGPDMAQIPAIAIQQVEVMRDGAAAQYGSDAIAGVINFALKRQAEGLELNVRQGEFYEGDGANTQLQANVGLPLGANGFVNISADYVDAEKTHRGGMQPAIAALIATYPASANEILAAYSKRTFGDPRVRAGHLFVNSGIDLGSGELYFFGNYGQIESTISFVYRAPRTVVGPNRFGVGTETFARQAAFRTIYLDPVAPGSNIYDVNGRTFNFVSMFPWGFVPKFTGTNTDWSGTSGYKGTTASGLNYDFSASWGRNELELNLKDSVNSSLGPDSPTKFYIGNAVETDKSLNIDLSRPMDVGLASPATLAGGLEWRNERYAFGAGDPMSYAVGPYSYQRLNGENPDPDVTGAFATQSAGSNGYPGNSLQSSVDKDRTSYAAYLDLAGDIGQKLSFDLAVRYEHFADFGSTTNAKVSSRYAITPALALRGAVSTGFRAPTSGQLFGQRTQTLFVGSELTEIATLPATDLASRYFGSQPLDPEKAKNFSFGAVFSPTDRISGTLDLYQIDVRDRIGISGQFTVAPTDRAALQAAGVPNWATLGRVQYFTNAFATRTRGLDLVLNHTLDTDRAGTFQTVLSANYNETEVTSRGTLPVNGVPTLIVDDIRKGNIEESLPKVRASLGETWTIGRFDMLARVNYAGTFTSHDLVANGGSKRYSPQSTVDLEISYNWTESFRLSLGGMNIFDSYPDNLFRALGQPNQNLYEATGTTAFGQRYPAGPFGNNGGFWYVRANFKL